MSYTPIYTDVGSIHVLYPAINSAQATGLTSDVVRAYIYQVEAEINFKLSRRYSLPIPFECPILNVLATRESIYRTALERGMIRPSAPGGGEHPLVDQHEQDQQLLLDIAEGRYNLVGVVSSGQTSTVSTVATDTTQSECFSTTMDHVPTFHEGNWVDQVQDTDKIEDQLALRVGRGL